MGGSIVHIRDHDRLERLLRANEIWGGYALGDLQEPHFSRTEWRLCEAGDARALVMSYTFGDGLTLMTFGDGRLVVTVLKDMDFSGPCDLHFHADHLNSVRPLFEGPLKAYLRLGVDRAEFHSVDPLAALALRALGEEDVPAALDLYRYYPQNFFAPERIGEGLYVGARREGRLIAVAGTHVVSPDYRVAAVGDIVVDPACRGQGIGAALTSSLCERLLEKVDLIVLNVAVENAAGRRCYEKLGFIRAVAHYEGFGVHRSGGD